MAKNCARNMRYVFHVMNIIFTKYHFKIINIITLQVHGYPTIKYFVDGDTAGEDYPGGRDFESLKQFVEEKLEVKCDVNDPKDCSEKEKGYIEKMKSKPAEERKKQLDRLSGMQGESMKAELKRWLNQRVNVLKGLEATAGEEL